MAKKTELALEYVGLGPNKRKEKVILCLCTRRKPTIKILCMAHMVLLPKRCKESYAVLLNRRQKMSKVSLLKGELKSSIYSRMIFRYMYDIDRQGS